MVLTKGIADPAEVHSIPLEISIMEGLEPIADWENTPKPYAKESVEMQELRRLEDIVLDYGDCYYVTDRASMAQGLFKRIIEMCGICNCKIDIITNARSDCTCYLPPKYKGKGRKPKRGHAFKIFSLFKDKEGEFIRTTEYLYGKEEEIYYYSGVFHWGQEWNGELLFVLCKSSRGHIVLACTDLNMDPLDVIILYSLRFGTIEEDFKWYKGDFAGMGFRFWSTVHPHLSHFRKKAEGHVLSEVCSEIVKKKLIKLLKREEAYMQTAFIAIGIVKTIAMNQPVGGIIQKAKPKRTYTQNKVSSADVQYFLRQNRSEIMKKYKKHEVIKHIRRRQRKERSYHEYL